MDVILICVDEIALEGLDGCTLDRLWRILEQRTPPLPMRIDSKSKEFLWKGIARCQELEFFLVKEVLTPEILKEQDKKGYKESDFDVETYPFKMVNDSENGVRGSSSLYETRENISSCIRGKDGQCLCSAEEARERWSDYLTIVASQELRNAAIFGADGDCNTPVLDLQYCLLEHIARARYRGRIQKYISTYFFQFDPKSTFHHLKKLQKKGLITRQQFVISKGGGINFISNVVLLRRFHSVRHHKFDIVGEKICKIINEAPAKEMAVVDLLIQMDKQEEEIQRKLFKKVRDYLVETGYLESFKKRHCGRGDIESSVSKSPKKKKKKPTAEKQPAEIEYLKLLKPFVLSSSDKTGSSKNSDGDDEEDGDEDSDDEEKLQPGDKNENVNQDLSPVVVSEKTWLQQTYDIIESVGQRGVSMSEINRMLNLPRLDVRLMVTMLKRQGYIKSVVQARGRAKITFNVAAPHYESSRHLKMIQKEQLKLKEMKEKLLDAKSSQGSASGSAVELTSETTNMELSVVRNSESADLVETGPKSRVKKSNLASQVTHRTLRRKTFIVELLKSSKVIEGEVNILKALQKHEENLGIGKVDRKTVSAIVGSLLADGLIKKVTTVVCHAGISVSVEFFLHSLLESDDPAVLSKIDQIRFKLFDREKQLKERLEAKKKREEVKQQKLKTASQKKSSAIESGNSSFEEGFLVDQDLLNKRGEGKVVLQYIPGNAEKYGYQRKYARAQILHEFVWQLVYGRGSKTESSADVTATGREESQNIELQKETSFSDASKDPSRQGIAHTDEDYDWVRNVASLPLYNAGRGWFRLFDIIPIMPLSMFCKLVGVTFEVKGLDEYFYDPSKKDTLLRELPVPLRSLLSSHCKCYHSIKEIAITLCAMGLLTPKHPIPMKKVQVMCHVSEGAIVIDTTTSIPGPRHVSPPTGTQFPSRSYVFSDFEKVKSYWWDLKCVCLNTPLGILRGKNEEPKSGKNRFKLDHFKSPIVKETNIGLPPGNGLGSAGLDSEMYGHLSRNWSNAVSKRILVATTGEKSLAEAKPPEIKKVVTEQKSIKKGGKGEKRNVSRTKRKPDTIDGDSGIPKPKKPKRISQIEPPAKTDKPFSSGYVAVDDIDEKALKKKKRMRIYFSPEEDSLILLCRVAQGIMKRSDRSFYPYKGWRRVLHETFESSEDKTAPSIHRRIFRLLKNPTNRHNCKICLAECRDDEEFQGFDDPDLPYEETLIEVVGKLKEKYRSTDLSSVAELNLVMSLKELHDNYTIEPLCPDQSLTTTSDQVSLKSDTSSLTANDVRLRNIRNLIQSAFMTPQDEHDAYRLYNMFGAHADSDLETVFVEMLADGLLTRKRCPNASEQFTRSLPFASMTYRLSFGYFKLFESSVSFNIVEESRKFLQQFERGQYQDVQGEVMRGQHEDCQGGANENQVDPNPGEMIFKKESTLGAHVACLLSLLAADKLTVEASIPDEIIELEMNDLDNDNITIKLQQSDDSDDDDEMGVQEKKSRSKKPSKKIRGGSESPKKKTSQKKGTVPREQAKKRKIAEAEGGSLAGQNPQNLSKKRKTTLETSDGDSAKQTRLIQSSLASDSHCGSIAPNSSRRSDAEVVKERMNLIPKDLESSTNKIISIQEMARHGDKAIDVEILKNRPCVFNEGSRSNQSSNDPVSSSVSNKLTELNNQAKEGNQDNSTKKPGSIFLDEPKSGVVNASPPLQGKEESLSQVFTLDTPAPVICKFTIPLKLSNYQVHCPYLHCGMEPWGNEGDFNKAPAKIPVAVVSNTILSRASRTSLFIARGRQTVKRTAQMLTTRAFNTHDVVSINNCRLKLILKPGVGPAMGPVESSSREELSGDKVQDFSKKVSFNDKETSRGLSSVIVPAQHEVVPLDEYTSSKVTEYGFNDADRALVTFIHDVVYKEGQLGLPLMKLEELFGEKQHLFISARHSLDDHINMMCSFKMIFKLGLYNIRLVCAEFARLWCAKLLKQKEKFEEGSKGPSEVDGSLQNNKCHEDPVESLSKEDKTDLESGRTDSRSSDTSEKPTYLEPVEKHILKEGNIQTTNVQTPSITQERASGKATEKESSLPQTEDVTAHSVVTTIAQNLCNSVSNVSRAIRAEETSIDSQPAASSTSDGPPTPLERKKSHRDEEGYDPLFVISRPWVSCDGSVNQKTFRMMEEAIALCIMQKPGIREDDLFQHFMSAVYPVAVREILEILQAKGCITRHCYTVHSRPTLFSRVPKDKEDSVPYYLPTLDCILRLATEGC